MVNTEIRERLRRTGMKQWELAAALNVSESTLIRWLRTELPTEKKELIMRIISERVGKKHDAHN